MDSVTMKAFAIVVTDKSGMKFARVMGAGHPTVNVCTSPILDRTFRDIAIFHDRAIAECYKQETIDFVKRDFRGTKICPSPPFKAEVVPFTVQLG